MGKYSPDTPGHFFRAFPAPVFGSGAGGPLRPGPDAGAPAYSLGGAGVDRLAPEHRPATDAFPDERSRLLDSVGATGTVSCTWHPHIDPPPTPPSKAALTRARLCRPPLLPHLCRLHRLPAPAAQFAIHPLSLGPYCSAPCRCGSQVAGTQPAAGPYASSPVFSIGRGSRGAAAASALRSTLPVVGEESHGAPGAAGRPDAEAVYQVRGWGEEKGCARRQRCRCDKRARQRSSPLPP